jgi:hypothetical protein
VNKVKEVYFGPATDCVAVRVKDRSEEPLQALAAGFVPNNSFYHQDHDEAVVVVMIPKDTDKLRTRNVCVSSA